MTPTIVLAIAAAGVAMLLTMIIRPRVEPFVTLLVVSLLVATLGGVPIGETPALITSGIGAVLGSVAVIIALGAMLGYLVDRSGGAQSVASHFGVMFGPKRDAAMLAAVGFALGIPVFFDVGFIILAPILVGFARVASQPMRMIGLSVAVAMLTVHVALPPHPDPVAAANLLSADVGLLTLLGFVVSIPVAMAGHFVASAINRRRIKTAPPSAFDWGADETRNQAEQGSLPSPYLVCGLIVLPIGIILLGTIGTILFGEDSVLHGPSRFLTSPVVALLFALAAAAYQLGLKRG